MTNPVGRPSKYQPSYCNQVIEEMTLGKSLTAFAAEIGVSRTCIQQWEKDYPEFSVAVKKGKAKCAAWWEARGRDIAEKGGGPGSATLAIFGMKNMGADDWQEKVTQEHTGANGGPLAVVIKKFDVAD